MPFEFKLPDIGEGIAEAEIVGWRVSVGDSVEEYQTVVEVLTDKAVVEVPAPRPGTVTELRAAEGEVVAVGSVIFVLDGEEAPAQVATEPASEVREEAPSAARTHQHVNATAPAKSSKPLAVPSARRRARDLGVDLALVTGSGRNGVIRAADVEAFARDAGEVATAPAPSAAPAPAPADAISVSEGEGQTRRPFRGVRRRIADAMTRSKFTATHFTVVEEVDVTELVALRAKARELGERQGVRVTYMPFIMKAVASALMRYPELNSQLDEATQEIVTFDHVNLGIAMDTDQGLIVPVIRDVQTKGALQLASELVELAERTREGRVSVEELRGGTFSITNAGSIGGILATPIINFPEVAILGVHRIVKRPGVVEGPDGDRIEVRHYMNISCSIDHRLVDGATGARFLVALKELLEHPGLLVLG